MTNGKTEFRPEAILGALSRRGASFVVIGGLAAEAHGVGWTTFDVDIVIKCSEDNYEALASALTDLDAVFHTAHQPPIRPDVSRLRSATGTLLFRTSHGRLDLLKEAGGETYDTLSKDAVHQVVLGVELDLADLAALARMKRAANRPKDRKVLPAIEAALKERDSD